MPFDFKHSRRDFIALLTALGATNLAALRAWAQQSMPLRRIPTSGETLPIIGLGSSKVISEIAQNGTEPVVAILKTLVEHGGRVVDTWPRDPANDSGFGRVIADPALRDKLFVTTKVSEAGQAGVDQLEQSLRSYGRETIDLAQIFSLTDLYTHWPTLQEWKASGKARYIGVTVSQYELYEELEAFLGRETPDFIQVNYSITERRAEERMLPLARDRGIAVIINRPFMNGEYFRRLAGVPLPAWTADLGIHTWAEFSLKYILPHPAITCVLTETSNPAHMAENALAAYGRMPDTATRQRMAAYMDQV
ncbi:MAG TPA: aldo/keto reductase [Gammaproteobacteria bacterium]|nr:aldo/keto reductase [Gammaproteobacteria bacterium]